MRGLTEPADPEEVRMVITSNLDRAAKLNFAQVQQESHLEGKFGVSINVVTVRPFLYGRPTFNMIV